MPVINGQPVSAEITNPAFLDAQEDDQAAGKIDFINTDPLSGDSVFNIQLNVNTQIQNEKIFVHTTTNTPVQFSSSFNFIFTEDLVIEFKDTGIGNTILAANSPIFLNDGESVYVTLNRVSGVNLVPSVNSVIPTTKDTFRIATRTGSALVLFDNTTIPAGRSSLIGGGSSATSLIKSDLFDPVSTTLPTVDPTMIDGVTVVSGTQVLFDALTSGAHQIYEATVSFGTISWTAQSAFESGFAPDLGDQVRIKSGTGFAEQLAVYDGTFFKVNDVVRYFSGTDYWEISSLKTSTLTDNTTGNVFTVAYSGSENINVDYSVIRNSIKRSGTIYIVTDGTTVSVVDTAANIGDCGVVFTGDISGSDLRLRYTTTSSGFNATMKYTVKRWSDSAGGPGGPPSYTSGSSPVGAAGSNGQIQFNSSGLLGADSDFTWDSTNNVLYIAGINYFGLQSATLVNNISSPTAAFFYSATLYPFATIEYSILRSSAYQVGRMLVVSDGFIADLSDDSKSIGSSGIVFSASYSGGYVNVNYTSTNTGFNGTLKYSIRAWA